MIKRNILLVHNDNSALVPTLGHKPMLPSRMVFLLYMPIENALSTAISVSIKGKDS